MGKVDITNFVNNQANRNQGAVSGSSSASSSMCSSASSYQNAQDVFEPAPAKDPAKDPPRAVPPAPEQAATEQQAAAPVKSSASSSSCSSSTCSSAVGKAPSQAEQQVQQGTAQGGNGAGLDPAAYRTRLNDDVTAAEKFGGHSKVQKDMRALVKTLIHQKGSVAQYDAVLEPLRASHRKAVLEQEARARNAQNQGEQQQQQFQVAVVDSVPGGGIAQWSKAVKAETHIWKVDKKDRPAALNLVRSTLSLIENADSNQVADHKKRLAFRAGSLKRHVRHLVKQDKSHKKPKGAKAPAKQGLASSASSSSSAPSAVAEQQGAVQQGAAQQAATGKKPGFGAKLANLRKKMFHR